jgi:uncharacterized protein (TIGR03382 family)
VLITVLLANRPPVLDPAGPFQVTEGSPLSFALSGSDPDDDPLTFGLAPLPAGAAFGVATRTFTWTPTYGQAGSYSMQGTVSDGRASDSKAVQVTVVAATFDREGGGLSHAGCSSLGGAAPWPLAGLLLLLTRRRRLVR